MFRHFSLRTGLWLCVGCVVLSLAGCGSAEDRAQSHYERGLELAAEGEPVKAGLEFRNALKIKENFVEALFQLGLTEEQQGNFESSVKMYFSVAEKDPKHVDARVKLVHFFLAAGNVEAAQKFAQQAKAIAGDATNVLVANAAVELKIGNRDEAIRLAQVALKQDPEQIDALLVLGMERILASDLAGALTFLDKAPTAGEGNIGFQVFRLGVLEALGDQPRVEEVFKSLSTRFPENAAIPVAMANWYLRKDRPTDAEAVVRDFAAKNPNDDRAQINLVVFLDKVTGSGAALAEAQKIIAARDAEGSNAHTIRMAAAQILYESGDHDKAIEFIKSVIQASGTDEDKNSARIQLANIFLNQGKLTEAEELTNEVLANDSKDVNALRIRASVRLKDDVKQAIDDLLAALNEAPDDIQLRSLLGNAYEREGSVVVAGDQYAKAMALANNSPATGLPYAQFLLRYGRTDQALSVLESVRERAPTDRNVLELLAQLKLNNQDWTGAQQIADALRKLGQNAHDVKADRIAAAASGGLSKYDESISLLQRSLELSANEPGGLSVLTRAYLQAGRGPAAQEFLISVLKDDPGDVEALIALGSVYMHSKSKELAEKAFVDAAAADKAGVLGNAALGQFYLATGNPAKAEEAARSGLARDDKSPVLHSLLGAVYQTQERFDDAIRQYEIIFEADPTSAVAANDLASLLSERGGDQESLERAYKIAQRFRNSQVPQYLDTLGWIYYLRKDYPAALPLIRTAAEQLPTVALVQFHLGMVLKELGQQSLAAERLSTAISLIPPLIGSDLAKAKQALSQIQVKSN